MEIPFSLSGVEQVEDIRGWSCRAVAEKEERRS